MEVTYQELIDAYSASKDLDMVQIKSGDVLMELDKADVAKQIRLHHEIEEKHYKVYKKEFWKRNKVYYGILNFDKVIDLYFEKDFNIYQYFEISFGNDTIGKDFRIDLRKDHTCLTGLSCYPAVSVRYLILRSSKINLVKGRKKIKGVDTDIMMLRCIERDTNKVTYFDLVEDPTIPQNLNG